MKAILGLVTIALLVVIPASAVQYTFVGDGLLVSTYALDNGGAAVVSLSPYGQTQYRLGLVYVPGDGQSAQREEMILPRPGLPDRVITDAHDGYVHVTLNWIGSLNQINNAEAPTIHHYRWTLPGGASVATGEAYRMFVPLLE